MYLKIRQDKISIVSEDAADAEYLVALFDGEMECTIDRESIRQGFCVIDEQNVRITFTKKEEL